MKRGRVRVAGFEWDEANTEHIARHNVEPEEAEEALRNRPAFRRSHSGRLVALGQTDAGRFVVVVFELRKEIARVVTARPASDTERRLYRKEMG